MTQFREDQIFIFDFDGVLADTYGLHVNFLQKIGVPSAKAESYLSNSSISAVRNRLLSMSKHFDKLFYRMLRTYISRKDNYLFKDVFDKIIEINQDKYILSMGAKKYIVKILGSHARHFKDVYGRFEIKRNKAVGYDMLISQHHIDPKKILFFTDTIEDIEIFNTLVPVEQIFAVDWGYCARELLAKHLPEKQIFSKEQFLAL